MNTSPPVDNGRYSHMSRQAAAAVQQNQPVVVQQVYQQPVEVVKELTVDDWVCSPVQAYHSAFLADSETLVARYAINPLNQTKCIIVQISPIQQSSNEESAIMERSRHQLAVGYQFLHQ